MQETTDQERIASHVRYEAARHNVSGRQIAEHLGLTQPAVSRRMQGHVAFSGVELGKLAELFAVSVSTLHGEGAA